MPNLQRYRDGQRMNHWVIALMFFCAALSGLAFFHPSLYFLSALFGGGPWTRILHPYMGLVMVLAFVVLAVQLWRDNRWTRTDTQWVKQSSDMLKGDKHKMPPAGKYNAGQKAVFWMMCLCLLVLVVTGFMFWHAWFPDGNILMRRVAVVLHAAAAVGLVLTVIIHIYAAIWVKGTIRAMTRGDVTESWARHNHPLWHKDVTGRQG